MTSSNLSRAHQYLNAAASMGSIAERTRFYFVGLPLASGLRLVKFDGGKEMLSLAKIQGMFEMDSLAERHIHCYADEVQVLQSFCVPQPF